MVMGHHGRIARRAAGPCLCAMIGCAAPIESDHAVAAVGYELSAPDTESPQTYRHPLRFAQAALGLHAGETPGLDVKDSPEGLRYAVETRTWSEAEGAQEQRFSGVVAVVRRPMSNEDYETKWERLASEGQPIAPEVVVAPKIGRALAAALATAQPSERLTALVRVARPATETLTTQLQRAIAQGAVDTADDLASVRRSLLQERAREMRERRRQLAGVVRAAGGSVAAPQYLSAMTVELPASAVTALAEREDVVSLDLSLPVVSDASGIDGVDVANGSQITQYNFEGWDGEQGFGTLDDVTFAIVDGCGVDDEHVAFGEPTSSRIRGRFRCEPGCAGGSCSSTANGCCTCSNFDYPGAENSCTPVTQHNTQVAGLVFGDLTDGQDPAFPGSWTTAQRDRSGYANEARGYVYDMDSTTATLRDTFDHMIGLWPAPSIANLSLSIDEDPTCLGQTALARDANDLYEAGILPIKSAGNNGFTSMTDCRIGSPGAAIGVFTVGGHATTPWDTAGETSVRTDDIFTFSSRGGTAAEGNGRTIVDLTAYACRKFMLDVGGGYSAPAVPCGTSYAVPTVSALALDLVDWWRTNLDNAIDDPGLLFANLLVMGDRQGESGVMNAWFDGLWGAGRLQARKWDADGMDSPYWAQAGFVCVDHGETVEFPFNFGLPLSPDVDVAKAVIYWYDRRHETGGTIDDIDLALVRIDTNTMLRGSLKVSENKERVYYTDPGGLPVRLEIRGYNVTTDDAGCGFNSQKVYYAWFYEDSDRDDFDGPYPAEIDPE